MLVIPQNYYSEELNCQSGHSRSSSPCSYSSKSCDQSDSFMTSQSLAKSVTSSSSSSNESVKGRRRNHHPKKNLMYHSSRYKTELCRQWDELGDCDYRDRCLFAHGTCELKPLPNRHPKYKTEKCSAFHDQGFCSFGPRCSFIHSKVDPAAVVQDLLSRLPELSNILSNPKDSNVYKRLAVFERICPSREMEDDGLCESFSIDWVKDQLLIGEE